MTETKEWVKVSRSADGKTNVTVTLVRSNLTSKWSMRSTSASLKADLAECRKHAHANLNLIEEALS